MGISRSLGTLCILLLMAAACGSSTNPPAQDGGSVLPDGGTALDGGAPTDGGAPQDGGPSNCQQVPDAGAPCSSFTNGASVVSEMQVAQNVPTFSGGTLVNGTYYLTAATKYTGPSGATGPSGRSQKVAFVLNGNTVQVSSIDTGCPDVRFTFTYTTSGGQMVGTFIRGQSGTQTFGYNATSTTVVLNVEENRVFTFAKQ